MPRIYYTASQYTGAYQHINTNTESFVRCRKLDLYRSMITVGNPSFITKKKIKDYGLFRALNESIIEKLLLVQINIDSNRDGIGLHNIFDTYVLDKKRIVSYNLGMAVAKFYASELFNIPNLIHVETLKDQGSIDIDTTNDLKEPDLVGMTDDGSWHVFEAKGMSRNQLTTKVREAKEQAQKVNTIHGTTPVTLNACATYFKNDKIISKIEDPKSKKEKDIKIKKDKFLESYYNPFFSFENKEIKRHKIKGLDYNFVDIHTDKLKLSIGLENEIYELIQQKDFNYIEDYYRRIKNVKKEFYDNETDDTYKNFSLGKDGFIVKYTDFN